mmetsp:Transcript_10530/g.19096  ORF Transcript_10530/g.19096 Transcript_10530/m.19096 type:complete len:494 (+) Transcript_10530:85-1566(+)
MEDCNCDWRDAASDLEDVTESTCSSATSLLGIHRCDSSASLSEFGEWSSFYDYEDSEEEEEEDAEEEEITTRTRESHPPQHGSVPQVDVYPGGELKRKAEQRSQRSCRMQPRDLKKALRKAAALRGQLEGRRHRVCAAHNAGPTSTTTGRRSRKTPTPQWQNFEACRQSLLQQNSGRLKADLMSVPMTAEPGWVACKYVEIKPVPVAAPVESRFMKALEELGPRALRMVYHGTNNKNLASIFEKGLLVPGASSGVAVAHGQSHGHGVYTARLGQAGADLALGFCQSSLHGKEVVEGVPQATWHAGTVNAVPDNAPPRPKSCPGERDLLLCGVLDDSQPVPPRVIGNHTLTASSENVSHVGDAIIVAREAHIVPMFVARVAHEMMWTRGVVFTGASNHHRRSAGSRRFRKKTTVKPRERKDRNADAELASIMSKLDEEIAETTEVIERLQRREAAHEVEVKRAEQRRCRLAARRQKERAVLQVWCEDWEGGEDH